MTTYLRRVSDGTVVEQLEIVADGWDLDEQLGQCESWLTTHPIPKAIDSFWALDVGFHKRATWVPGYTVPVSLMKLLVANDVALWLSLYPGTDSDGRDSA